MELSRAGMYVLRRCGCLAALSGAALLAFAGSARAQSTFTNWETAHVSPLTLTPSGQTLLAVNTPDNRLEVFDVSGAYAANPRRIRSIPVGLDPVTVRVRSETEIWVVNQISDSISIIDLPSGRVVRTLQTGDEPADVVFPVAMRPPRAFVTCASTNRVLVYEMNDLSLPPTVVPIAGSDPRMMATSPDGTVVYVAIFGSGNETTCVKQQDVSNASGPYGGVNPPPNSGNAFVPPLAAGLPTPPAVAMIVRRNAAGQWMDDNNHNWSPFVAWNLADNDVAIIDAANLSVTYAKGMLSSVMAIGVKPDGTVTTVGLDARNEVRFEPNVQSRFIRVEMGQFSPASPALTAVADLNPHLIYSITSVPQPMRDLSVGDPRGIVWHPTSGKAYVSGMGSDNVIVTNGAGTRFAEVTVGKGPTGLAISPDGSHVYALSKFDATVSSIDTTTNSETARVHFYDPTPAAIRLGRPFLYDTHHTSGLGQISCASCHIDGRADFLAWDLGSPAGAMKLVNQPCFMIGFCTPWHPMKGPMVTQVLQGIVGVEPLHWRGDREDLAAFAPAFTGLQGMDAQPTQAQMQQFTDFVATIKYPPNPNRQITDTLPATVTTADGSSGDPANGGNIFVNQPVLASFKCATCHTLPLGTNRNVDSAVLAGVPQSLKIPHLRGLERKQGWDPTSQQSIRGFGFNHDSNFGSIDALLQGSMFNFTPSMAAQQRHDIEAFLKCLTNDTHPAIGQQVMFDGTNNSDPAAIARLNTLLYLADGTNIGVVAKGRLQGQERGWFYYGAGTMQSDRHGEQISVTVLRTGAAAGSEIVFTAVPSGSQIRMGVDRDLDGFYDAEEIGACCNPADPTNFPGSRGALDVDANFLVNVNDIFAFLTRWFAQDPRADFDGMNGVTVQDIFAYLAAWFAHC